MLVIMMMDYNADINVDYLESINFTFHKQCLVVSFFLLSEYLNEMCIGIQGTKFKITSWAK